MARNRSKSRVPSPEERERLAVEAGIAETLALEEARGAAFVRSRSPRAPHARLDGLGWLASKGRLRPAQGEAGRRYGDLYRRIYLNGQYRTAIDDRPRGHAELNPMEARGEDLRRMLRAREAGLGGLKSLAVLCDEVCGEGRRITDLERDDRRVLALEERLRVALDLLAAHYGLR